MGAVEDLKLTLIGLPTSDWGEHIAKALGVASPMPGTEPRPGCKCDDPGHDGHELDCEYAKEARDGTVSNTGAAPQRTAVGRDSLEEVRDQERPAASRSVPLRRDTDRSGDPACDAQGAVRLLDERVTIGPDPDESRVTGYRIKGPWRATRQEAERDALMLELEQAAPGSGETEEALNAQLLTLVLRFGKECSSPEELEQLASDLERHADHQRRSAALWRKVGTAKFTDRPNAVHIEPASLFTSTTTPAIKVTEYKLTEAQRKALSGVTTEMLDAASGTTQAECTYIGKCNSSRCPKHNPSTKEECDWADGMEQAARVLRAEAAQPTQKSLSEVAKILQGLADHYPSRK